MTTKSDAETTLEEYKKRHAPPDRDISDSVVALFNDAVNSLENNDHVLETIFDFIRQNQALITNLTLQQWVTLKNHFNRLYESITFLTLLLETAKNLPFLPVKEFTLFVTHIIHQKISVPVTPDDFKLYRKESLFHGRAEDMRSKYPATKKQVEALYKKQLDERLMLTHLYLTESLRIRMETQARLTGISAAFKDAEPDSDTFRQDLDEKQKKELKNGMTQMADSAYHFIRRVNVFLQYAYATEKENFNQTTGASAISQRVSFYITTDKEKSFNYLKQAKSSLFLARLSFRTGVPQHPPNTGVSRLLRDEQHIIKELERIFTAEKVENFTTLSELSTKRKELDDIYRRLACYPYFKDYIDLRKGLPVRYKAVQDMLK
ncbi:MAG: hypothetical protein GY765_21000 [bacterium]|nr:hypothetical protein [bacterium]